MDLEQLNTLLDHSRTFYDQVRDTSSSIQHSPVTGSVAAVELESLAAQGNHVALTTAYSQAYLYKEAALCGFDGLLRTLTPPALPISPWYCARPILEASAHCCWLADTDITKEERLARSYSIRFESVFQIGLSEGLWGRSQSDLVDDRPFQGIIDSANSLGLTIKRNNGGHLQWIGVQKPKFSELVKMRLPNASQYGKMSLIVHAHPLALIRRLASTVSTVQHGRQDLIEGLLEIPDEDIVHILRFSADALLIAVKQILILNGFHVAPVTDHLDSLINKNALPG